MMEKVIGHAAYVYLLYIYWYILIVGTRYNVNVLGIANYVLNFLILEN